MDISRTLVLPLLVFLITNPGICDCQIVLTPSEAALTPENRGNGVTREVVDLIQNSTIFPDDKGFLLRIAQVESKCGVDPNTYRAGYHGGIWQVDRIGFDDTQNTSSHPTLSGKFKKIKETFKIDWSNVTWIELRKPLFSGIAARLFLSNVPDEIPDKKEGQANYWKQHYNRDTGEGTSQKFLGDLTTAKGDPHIKQLLSKSDHPLCYDIYGEDGATYNFLEEPNLDLKILIQLIAADNDINAKYIRSVAIMFTMESVAIDEIKIKIGEDLLNWDDAGLFNVSADGSVSLSISNNSVQFDYLGLVYVKVNKPSQQYLNLDITYIGQLYADATGIIGDVSRRVSITDNGSSGKLHIRQRDDTVSSDDLQRTTSCWTPLHPEVTAGHLDSIMIKNKVD